MLVLKNASFTIVEMDEKIAYRLSTIFLYKDGNLIKKINSITTLHFVNRINRLTFHNEVFENFSGYGELSRCTCKALASNYCMSIKLP